MSQNPDTPTQKLHWAIKLRLKLLIKGSHKWNAWVRDVTARLEKS